MVSAAVDRRLVAIQELIDSDRPRSALESLCLQRQVEDLRHGHERGLVWDEDEAVRNIKFCSLMHHWKGAKAGLPFKPEPWQEHCIIGPLFGWYRERARKDGGKRRFTTGYTEIPRKNGKTFLASVIANQGLIADKEKGAEVYSAATKRDQATILFKDAKMALGRDLKRVVKVLKGSITCPSLQSTFMPLSSDYNSLDGLNIHRAVIDELHAHKTRDLWDVLMTAMGARLHPMILAITTAGFDRSSICWEMRQISERVLRGDKADDSLFAFIACAEDHDDWQNPATWRKANPNLGVSLYEDYLADLCRQADASPSAENNFRRKHLDQWTEQSVRWLPMTAWDSCDAIVEVAELHGQPCWAGLDLASTRDVNSLVLVFPRDGGYVLLPYFWVPEEAKDERGRQDRTQVMNWASRKDETGRALIKKTAGNITDYRTIAEDVMELSSQFDIQELSFDPWSPAQAFVQILQEMGFPYDKLGEHRQGFASFAAPTKEFYRLVIGGKIVHNKNPVLRWMAANVAVKEDASGNVKPDKARSSDKIDGIVASIMGIGRALQLSNNEASWNFEPGSLAL